jgi:outer membrane protein OmpA-like peptidoglycan-associated protein
MLKHTLLMATALAALALSQPSAAAPDGIKVGVLSCNVASGWGYILGSSKDVTCTYHPNHGEDDRYTGSISKFGVDIGYTSSGELTWDVIAPTSDMRAGALQGDYAGASASATVIAGLGAHALFGGFDKSIALQPVSFESSCGLDVSGGIGELSLRAIQPPAQISEVAPPQPPALPPAPPPEPRAEIHSVIFQVEFRFDKATLTPEGREIVRHAADAAERLHLVRILVTGNADRVGSADYNQDLSLRRAETIKAELVRDGLDENLIVTAGRGFCDPVVPTAAGVRERLNRRVVIDIRTSSEPRQAWR